MQETEIENEKLGMNLRKKSHQLRGQEVPEATLEEYHKESDDASIACNKGQDHTTRTSVRKI